MNKNRYLLLIPIVLLAIYAVNYLTLNTYLQSILKDDSRNKTLAISTSYQYYINPKTIVVDVKSVDDDNSLSDILRSLFQLAEKLKERDFDKVILASSGKHKFYIDGEHFKKIGEEHEYQNPVYTLRTLPENIYTLDGKQAYPNWTGGVLGVMGKQMEDLNEFGKKWVLEDYLDL